MNKLIVFYFFFLSFLSEASTIKVKRIWDKKVPNGLYYVASDENPRPGVILLHGSEGGSARSLTFMAMELVHEGYNVMTYCYFNCWHRPGQARETLANIELTKIIEDMRSFKRSKYVSNKYVLYGHSRGAELALILASKIDKENSPKAVIVHAPSHIYTGIYSAEWKSTKCWICKKENNECKTKELRWNYKCGNVSPNKIFKHPDWKIKSAWNFNKVNIPQNQRIEIEKYSNPILITHGEKDKVWSVERTKKIEKTLKDANHSPEVHYFKNAGHTFYKEDEWKRRSLIINFLIKNLKK